MAFTFDPLLKRSADSVQNGVPVFIAPDALSSFKETETAFWDLEYKDRDVAETDTYRHLSFHDHFRKPLLALPAGAHILEIGCGTRSDMLEIAQAGKHVILSDLSPVAVEKAMERAQQMGVADNCSGMVCDAEDLPFADNSLDAVFIAASLHHLPHPEIGMKEFYRVLKPGGVFVAGVEPNTWPYYTVYALLKPIKWFIRKRRGRKVDSIADDTTVGFSYFSLRKILWGAGFVVEDIHPVKFFLEWYDSGIRLVNRLFHRQLVAKPGVQRAILRVDDLLGKLPIVRWFPWHWNAVARKK